jgi:hypothetical protein
MCQRKEKHLPHSQLKNGNRKKVIIQRWLWKWLWPTVGLVSFVWFLLRVLPKPSRATYPCQRLSFPLASGFIIWLFGLGGATAAIRKARKSFSCSRYILGIVCICLCVGCFWLSLTLTADKEAVAGDPHPVNSPIGTARGVHPGRVVWVHDPEVTDWEGPFQGDGYWWQSSHTDQNRIDAMLEEAILALTGESNLTAAWNQLFHYFNNEQGRGNVGYQTGEKIMIKVNFVGMIAVGGNSNYNLLALADEQPAYANCSPQIMHALLHQLVYVAGVAQADITIGDPICLWCHEFYDMIQPDFPNVRFLDYLGQNNRTQIAYSDVPFYWSTSNADGKIQDYVLQSYVDADYFVNLASLKGHYNQAGVTLGGKNHFGSLRCPTKTGYYNMHSDCPFNVSQEGSYRNMVDLMGHKDVGGKTFLCLFDGLYCGKHAVGYPENLPQKWQMEPFNNDWPSSIFVSQDPVAIDSVGFDFLITEWPEANGPAHIATDDYLHEAALADNPPSQTFYDPEGDGTRLSSLGVHEHWNNPIEKQYSRNLGTGSGIELVPIMMYNLPPQVDAGDDQIVTTLEILQLNSAVLDDGKPSPPGQCQVSWSLKQGPEGGEVLFADPNQRITIATFTKYGMYQLQCTADDTEYSDTDDLIVIVTVLGDINCDGTEDIVDLSQFGLGWLQTGCNPSNEWCNRTDLNFDQTVNLMDFGHLANSWPTEDGIPPKPPTDLLCTAGDQTVELDWDDNADADLAGYNVYRSTTSGSGYSKINCSLILDSNYTDSTVTNNTTYYYVVTAQDQAANNSYPSSEHSATPFSDLLLYMEAEGGSGITGSWSIGSDGSASGGKYLVWTGADSLNDPSGSDQITYSFTAPVTGLYKVYLRIITPPTSGNHDSAWIRIDGADLNQSVNITRIDGWIKFNNMIHVTVWTWDQVHNADNGNALVQFYLSAGAHTLRIGYREDGTQIDRIFLTNTTQIP